MIDDSIIIGIIIIIVIYNINRTLKKKNILGHRHIYIIK